MNGPKQGKILIFIVVPEVRKEAFKERSAKNVLGLLV